jgi:hypothetical protein
MDVADPARGEVEGDRHAGEAELLIPTQAGYPSRCRRYWQRHVFDQTARMRPSCWRAVTPSSRPISSAIVPFSIRSTVIPVNRIFRSVAVGKDPIRKSLKAGPVCVLPPSWRPTTRVRSG